ncbi:MAG: hypothetical protein HPAVJP_3980 [Candidatus Hepatoplasma vulgare]|nr:MAG: hypothetical protein HPAVJP_3980 [Candidatus Hepatoplasma sp.]
MNDNNNFYDRQTNETILLNIVSLIKKNEIEMKKRLLEWTKVIKNNKYYLKVWDLLSIQKIEEFEEEPISLDIKIKYIFDFYTWANTISYDFMKYIFNDVLNIDRKKEKIDFIVLRKFYDFQFSIRIKINDFIDTFESSLRNILKIFLRKLDKNLTEESINYEPIFLRKKDEYSINFKKSFKDAGKDLRSNECFEIIFEEMVFQDYINIIKDKIKDKDFEELMKIFYSNSNKINIDFLSIFGLNKNDEDVLHIFKDKFLKEMENIKLLRNKISHRKTIIFKGYLKLIESIDNFNLKESINSLYKISFVNGSSSALGLRPELQKLISNLKEELISIYPYKEKNINSFFNNLI